MPTSAAWFGAGHERLVQVHDVGLEAAQRLERAPCDRAPGRDRRDRAVARRPRCSGPTVVTPGSGGGPSHGPMTRASTPSVRSARASPSTWPCTPPGATASTGTTTSHAHRVSLPWEIIAGGSRRRPCTPSSRRLQPVARPVGCIRCHCSGAARMSSSKRWASSWVIRATRRAGGPSARRDRARMRISWRPCGRK